MSNKIPLHINSARPGAPDLAACVVSFIDGGIDSSMKVIKPGVPDLLEIPEGQTGVLICPVGSGAENELDAISALVISGLQWLNDRKDAIDDPLLSELIAGLTSETDLDDDSVSLEAFLRETKLSQALIEIDIDPAVDEGIHFEIFNPVNTDIQADFIVSGNRVQRVVYAPVDSPVPEEQPNVTGTGNDLMTDGIKSDTPLYRDCKGPAVDEPPAPAEQDKE